MKAFLAFKIKILNAAQSLVASELFQSNFHFYRAMISMVEMASSMKFFAN